ncbi:NUDIX hydrolase [uncultured Limosilactobacillus sp.]|uniref:NUDIX hydrolase n=1 Tax=uncultured Limosilactobacillus sp. TaxID=2837629 RepID=UPI0025E51782|nr:NUDIX hydrolase [uncultured Limosilactobacillus sp.]
MSFKERVTDVKSVYQGNVIEVELQTVETPNGHQATRDVVRHAPAIAILAITNDHKMILERQWRNPVNQVTIEFPAGKLDERDHGDDFLAAKRELNEETRYQAEKLVKINEAFSSSGFTDEKLSFYLATGLSAVDEALPQDADEQIELIYLSLPEALAQIRQGKINDLKTIMAIYFWQSMVGEANE